LVTTTTAITEKHRMPTRVDDVNDEAIATTDLATLIRDYQAKDEEVRRLKDSIKPAQAALKEANALLRAALKEADAPVVLDGYMYRLLGNGQLSVEEIRVLGSAA